jgi:hypothetical protein
VNRDFLDFYKRWIDKANQYNTNDLSECFDKFITLFILYNFQYSYIARKENIVKPNGWFKDKEMATVIIKNHFPVQDFCDDPKVTTAITAICSLVTENIFFIRNDNIDKKLLKNVQSANVQDKCKGILEMLYFIRCNLFHGQKEFTDSQKAILIPCIEILQILNAIIFDSLGRSP